MNLNSLLLDLDLTLAIMLALLVVTFRSICLRVGRALDWLTFWFWKMCGFGGAPQPGQEKDPAQLPKGTTHMT